MPRDQEEELQRLEAALWEEDGQTAPEENAQEADLMTADHAPTAGSMLYRNYSNGYGGAAVQAWSQEDLDEDDYEQEVSSTERKSDLRILTAVALALLAGIFCMLAYWAVRFF